MKKLFIIGKSDLKISIKDFGKLGKRVGLVTTAQHLDKIDSVKKTIEKSGRKCAVGGQILGCSASNAVKIANEVDCFLYVGDGRFHPIEVYLETKKPVYVISDGKIIEFDAKLMEKYEKNKLVARMKYLSADNVGILVSTKEHQEKMKQALELKKRLVKEGKEAFIFVFDQLDFGQLENFPFVDVWVNTACPRLVDDYDKFNKPILNIDDTEFEEKKSKFDKLKKELIKE